MGFMKVYGSEVFLLKMKIIVLTTLAALLLTIYIVICKAFGPMILMGLLGMSLFVFQIMIWCDER